MPQINDAINAAIANIAGDQNALPDKLLRYYLANGAVSLDRDVAEYEFLVARGAALVLGAEEVVDPTFTASTAWTEDVGWVAGTNKTTVNGTQVGIAYNTNSAAITAGQKVMELYLDSIRNGVISVEVAAAPVGGAFNTYSTPGIHRRLFTAVAGAARLAASIDAVGQVSRLSIRPVTTLGSGKNQMNDMWEYYLRVTKAYTGALDDMLLTYWTTGPRP